MERVGGWFLLRSASHATPWQLARWPAGMEPGLWRSLAQHDAPVSILIRDDVRRCVRVMHVAAAAPGQH